MTNLIWSGLVGVILMVAFIPACDSYYFFFPGHSFNQQDENKIGGSSTFHVDPSRDDYLWNDENDIIQSLKSFLKKRMNNPSTNRTAIVIILPRNLKMPKTKMLSGYIKSKPRQTMQFSNNDYRWKTRKSRLHKNQPIILAPHHQLRNDGDKSFPGYNGQSLNGYPGIINIHRNNAPPNDNYNDLLSKMKQDTARSAEDIKRRNSVMGPGEVILGAPTRLEHLPEAQPILPGHTLLRPARGMLKSAVKYPLRDFGSSAVYGNLDNLGITHGKTLSRIRYSDFRKANDKDTLQNLIQLSKFYSGQRIRPLIVIEIDPSEINEIKKEIPDFDHNNSKVLDDSEELSNDDNNHGRRIRRSAMTMTNHSEEESEPRTQPAVQSEVTTQAHNEEISVFGGQETTHNGHQELALSNSQKPKQYNDQESVIFDDQKAAKQNHQPSALFDNQTTSQDNHQESSFFDGQKVAQHNQQDTTLLENQKTTVSDDLKTTPYKYEESSLFVDDQKAAKQNHQPSPLFDDPKTSQHNQQKSSLFDEQKISQLSHQKPALFDKQKAAQHNQLESSLFDDQKVAQHNHRESVLFDQNGAAPFNHPKSLLFDHEDATKFHHLETTLFDHKNEGSVLFDQHIGQLHHQTAQLSGPAAQFVQREASNVRVRRSAQSRHRHRNSHRRKKSGYRGGRGGHKHHRRKRHRRRRPRNHSRRASKKKNN